MNAPLWPVHRRPFLADEPPSPEADQHHVWHSRFGAMVIEVLDGVAYVNGARVEPVASPSSCIPSSAAPEGDHR